MGSLALPHLPEAWHVDQAIISEAERVVVIRFGKDADPECMRQDDVLGRVQPKVENYAVIYLCDNDKVKDFNKSRLRLHLYLYLHKLTGSVRTLRHVHHHVLLAKQTHDD